MQLDQNGDNDNVLGINGQVRLASQIKVATLFSINSVYLAVTEYAIKTTKLVWKKTSKKLIIKIIPKHDWILKIVHWKCSDKYFYIVMLIKWIFMTWELHFQNMIYFSVL